MTDLMANHGWRHIEATKLWESRVTLTEQLIKECGEMPDIVLFWHGFDSLSTRANEVIRLNCHKYFFADDLHWGWNKEGQTKFLCFSLFDTILTPYAYVFENFYPQLARMKQIKWVPHSASPDFMLPYNRQPMNKILLSGCLEYYYPFRQLMKKLHERGLYPIVYRAHPGYDGNFDYVNDQNVGRGYATTINKYRVGFTDSTEFHYMVAKYFEIPATGALLLADGAVAGPLKELGMIENTHYIPVSPGDLEEQIEYVLNENSQRHLDKIRKNGQELVWEKHKTSDRARLINEICVA